MVIKIREVTPTEGRRLSRLASRTTNAVVLRRAHVLLHSAQGIPPPKIADLLGLSVEWVRHIIKEFNRVGFEALDPKPRSGGRPRIFDDEIRLEMVNLALTSPKSLGYPFQSWSLRKLRDAIIEREIVADISPSNLGIILREEALSYQVVKSWKESKDPEFDKKKRRIDTLTAKKHNPPVLLAFDELGPLELRPQRGRVWAKETAPQRLSATYVRTGGTRQYLAAMNYHKGTFFGRLRRRKRSKEVLGFFKQLRRHYPIDQHVHIIMDNFAAHTTQEILQWAKRSNVSFALTPTNASWLNPIECQFEDIRQLALAGTYPRSWEEVERALSDALRYKNARRGAMLRAREERRRRKRLLWRARMKA